MSGIIVAAGHSTRLTGPTLKQFLPVHNRPMLAHTISRFEECEVVDRVVIVVPQGRTEYCRREILAKFGFTKVTECVEGGKTRQDSVYCGLDAAAGDIVCVHDGVRPAVTCGLITECIESARLSGAAVVAVPVKDTIKRVSGNEIVTTLDRRELWEAQTPQAFRRELLMSAFAKAREDGFLGTDESSLVERIGVKVHVVRGNSANIKVTTPEDLRLIRTLMEAKT